MSAPTYVNTNAGDSLGYPYILRVTFGEPWYGNALTDDIANLVNNESSLTGVVIASDPTVPPGTPAVTIDFAPTDSFASTPVAQILSQIQSALVGTFQMMSNTTITRVEKVNAQAAQGDAGGLARGTDTAAAAAAAASSSFMAQVSALFGNAQNLLIVGAVIAGLFYFGSDIKAALKSVEPRDTA